MTTNEYIKGVKNEIYPPFNKRIWQHNYYDRIIRNEHEYQKILQYIETNLIKWKKINIIFNVAFFINCVIKRAICGRPLWCAWHGLLLTE